MTDFRLKTGGRVNKWDVIMGAFELDTPMGRIGIVTNNAVLINELVEAMKNREKVFLTVGEAEE